MGATTAYAMTEIIVVNKPITNRVNFSIYNNKQQKVKKVLFYLIECDII